MFGPNFGTLCACREKVGLASQYQVNDRISDLSDHLCALVSSLLDAGFARSCTVLGGLAILSVRVGRVGPRIFSLGEPDNCLFLRCCRFARPSHHIQSFRDQASQSNIQAIFMFS